MLTTTTETQKQTQEDEKTEQKGGSMKINMFTSVHMP